MTTLAKTFGYSSKADAVSSGTASSIYNPTFVVGIEVEVENARDRNPGASPWFAQTDGSLRNDGREFVTPPLASNSIEVYTNPFWDQMPARWTFSQRTSIHVHVNARDLTWQQLKMWLLTYCVFEKVLFDFAGVDRAKGIFCVPLLDTQYPDYMISKLVARQHGAQGNWEKYSAVNLSRLSDLGTVEFRHLPGTRDKEKVLLWLKVLDDIRTAGISFTEEQFLALLDMGSGRAMMHRVFSQRVLDVFATKQIEALCKEGVDVVRTALAGEKIRDAYIAGLSLDSPFNKWLLKGRK